MQVPRPPAVGDESAVKQLRAVLFSEPILGAARVRPKGYTRAVLSHLLGWAGPFIAKRATEPLPPTILFLAVTPVDIRIFAKPIFSDVFEVGRWPKRSYRATIRETRVGLALDLELERLGRATVMSGSGMRSVFDLATQGAAGPVL